MHQTSSGLHHCNPQPQNLISTLNLSGETLCQKLHFMYYRQPFREYSCVINFHFKAKSLWNEMGTKNKINKIIQRDRVTR